jgi:kynurenine formamidase
MIVKIYDLSLPLYDRMPVFPGTPPVEYIVSHTIEKDSFNLAQAVINTHAGTHTDAPKHFISGASGLEGIGLEAYVGKALIVDCTSKRDNDTITVDDMKPYENKISKGSRIIIRTDWYKYASEPKYFTDYPRISMELARWFVERGVIMLGVEPPSLNPPQYIEVHRILLEGGVTIIEGLSKLDEVKKNEIFFVGAPVIFKDADGFPLRAIAIDISELVEG